MKQKFLLGMAVSALALAVVGWATIRNQKEPPAPPLLDLPHEVTIKKEAGAPDHSQLAPIRPHSDAMAPSPLPPEIHVPGKNSTPRGETALTSANDSLKRELAEVKEKAERAEKENAAIKAYLCAKDPNATICTR